VSLIELISKAGGGIGVVSMVAGLSTPPFLQEEKIIIKALKNRERFLSENILKHFELFINIIFK
jgi:hypothetical protein